MKSFKLFLVSFLLPVCSFAQGIVSTFAGTGISGHTGDGGPATAAQVIQPYHGCFDKFGNYYFISPAGDNVRKVAPDGIITTVAGNNGSGYSGDGGLAVDAKMEYLHDVACDKDGNIYILQGSGRCYIRKIDVTTGIITRFAGSDTAFSINEGGPALGSYMQHAFSFCFDKTDNIYVTYNGIIRKIDVNGIITTLCYTGASVVGGPIELNMQFIPEAICTDTSGNIYFTQLTYIRRINTDGTIETLVGNGNQNYNGEWLPGTQTSIYAFDLDVDNFGNVYFTDTKAARIRVWTTNGMVHTISGSDTGYAGDNGPAIDAKYKHPYGIDLDSCDNIYIADGLGNAVRKITYPYCHALSIAGAEKQSESVRAWPNPASTQLTIKSSDKISSVSIVDVTGRIVLERIVNSEECTVDVSGLSSGVYFVTVRQVQGEVRVVRFVRE